MKKAFKSERLFKRWIPACAGMTGILIYRETNLLFKEDK